MMPEQTTLAAADIQSLLVASVALWESPAAVVVDGEVIVAHNEQWESLAARGSVQSSRSTMLSESLRSISPVEEMFEALRTRCHTSGSLVVTSPTIHGHKASDWEMKTYQLSWHQIEVAASGRTLALIVLKESTPANQQDTFAAEQQELINKLLVRQTLIEESERRRLSVILHDGLVQDLAQLHGELSSIEYSQVDTSEARRNIKQMIDDIRSLIFEFTPPVLNDLGFYPALQWLTEFLSEKYDVRIALVAEHYELNITENSRTILFRAVRELAVNAAKHAPDADIEISYAVKNNMICIIVRDDGPGFDIDFSHNSMNNRVGFGLISIAKQIHGIGGVFNLVSTLEDGTTATITLPNRQEAINAND